MVSLPITHSVDHVRTKYFIVLKIPYDLVISALRGAMRSHALEAESNRVYDFWVMKEANWATNEKEYNKSQNRSIRIHSNDEASLESKIGEEVLREADCILRLLDFSEENPKIHNTLMTRERDFEGTVGRIISDHYMPYGGTVGRIKLPLNLTLEFGDEYNNTGFIRPMPRKDAESELQEPNPL